MASAARKAREDGVGVSLFDKDPNGCSWPVGRSDPARMDLQRFCGAPRAATAHPLKKAYCAAHGDRAVSKRGSL